MLQDRKVGANLRRLKALVPEAFLKLRTFLIGLALAGIVAAVSAQAQPVPAEIAKVQAAPRYKEATWGLRVVDAATGEVLIDQNPDRAFFLGSVRKVFSVGLLLDAIGPDHTYDTPVFRLGEMHGDGELEGDLVLVASGDLCMGGRENPDGTVAVTNFDHNEADSLGNAELTAPDPLAGYRNIAKQIAGSGIKRVRGDVVIDDRLFEPFNFRGEFEVTPIFVNDDVVDVSLSPGTIGGKARYEARPLSSALTIQSAVLTVGPGSQLDIQLDPEVPSGIGTPGLSAKVKGLLPADYKPPFTNAFPLVRTFRISSPSNFARTVLIEALKAEGVKVDAPVVAPNPVAKLPAKGSYIKENQVALLTGDRYGELARYVLKVSYNLGADTSLMLLGLTQGVDTQAAALEKERGLLEGRYGLNGSSFHFIDGSGGGDSTATTTAVTTFLAQLLKSQHAQTFLDALPTMGIDGSLGFVKDYEMDPTLAGATNHVWAKPGTYVLGSDKGLVVKGQAFGGVIETRGGRRLIYQVAVNEVPIDDIEGLMQIFQDQGTISAILWRDY